MTEQQPALREDDLPADAYAVILGGDEVVSAHCLEILRGQGVVQALGFLNARTRYRFTGLYRTEPPLLHNLFLFDRENPGLSLCAASKRLEETYCALVWSNGRPFSVADGRACPPPAGWCEGGPILSYCGVPIRAPSGFVEGTLCHFDVRPRVLQPLEVEILQAVAPHFLAEVTRVRPTP